MFAWRSRASKRSDVESRTIAVFSRVRSTARTLRRSIPGRRGSADRGGERLDGSPFSTSSALRRRGSRRAPRALASAVRHSTAAPEVAITARVAAAPSMPGSRKSISTTSARSRARRVGRLAPRPDRADDLDPLLEPEEQLERRAVHVVVLDEQDPHPAASASLGREQQRVVGLPTPQDADLEPVDLPGSGRRSRPPRARLSPVARGRTKAVVRESLEEGVEHRPEVVPGREGPPVDIPRYCPSLTSTPSTTASRDARVISAASTPARAARIASSFASASAAGVERRAPRRSPPGSTSSPRPGRLWSTLRGALGGEADVRVVRQDDHVLGVGGRDRLEQLSDRRVRRRSSLDDDRRPLAAEDLVVPAALRDRHERGGGRRGGGCGLELREPALPRGRLAPHVADLDVPRIDHPDGPPELEHALGLVGVDVDLEHRRVARDEQ